MVKITNRLFSDAFSDFLMENPQIAKRIVEKGILAAKARVAAKRAREVTRKKSGLETLFMRSTFMGVDIIGETHDIFMVTRCVLHGYFNCDIIHFTICVNLVYQRLHPCSH